MSQTLLPRAVSDALCALDLVGTSVTWNLSGDGECINLHLTWSRIQAESRDRKSVATVSPTQVSMPRTSGQHPQTTVSGRRSRRQTPSDCKRNKRRLKEFLRNKKNLSPTDSTDIPSESQVKFCDAAIQTYDGQDGSCETRTELCHSADQIDNHNADSNVMSCEARTKLCESAVQTDPQPISKDVSTETHVQMRDISAQTTVKTKDASCTTGIVSTAEKEVQTTVSPPSIKDAGSQTNTEQHNQGVSSPTNPVALIQEPEQPDNGQPQPSLYWEFEGQQVMAIHNIEQKNTGIMHYVSLASGKHCWVPDDMMPEDDQFDEIPYLPKSN